MTYRKVISPLPKEFNLRKFEKSEAELCAFEEKHQDWALAILPSSEHKSFNNGNVIFISLVGNKSIAFQMQLQATTDQLALWVKINPAKEKKIWRVHVIRWMNKNQPTVVFATSLTV